MAPKRIADVARYHRDAAVARALAAALGLVLLLGFTSAEAAPPTRDFSSDLKEDILWLNTTTGQVAVWLMNGTAITSTGIITTVSEPWAPVSGGDFNGDGRADILWLQIFDHRVAIWLMNGTAVLSTALVANVPTQWTVQGVGDFGGDDTADILWRNADGKLALWEMDGGTVGTTSVASASIVGTVPLSWTVAGLRDFNGDARADILWRQTTGEVAIWLMDGDTVVGSGVIATDVSNNWSAQ